MNRSLLPRRMKRERGDISMSDKNQFMNIPEMLGESLPFLNNKENGFSENEGGLDVYKHGAFISCVKFGNYIMQTAVMPSDLKVWVELEWYIIDIKDEEALLIADKCIAWDFYCGDNTLFEPACSCSWEKSYVREYLNDKFYSEAFTEKEKELIISRNEYNDKIFLLDLDEIEKLFAFEDLRRGETYFADDFHGRIEVNLEPTWWWINTVGSEPNRMCVMSPSGEIYTDGRYTDADETGIRPAMWVNLKKLLEYKDGVSKTIYVLDSTLDNR